MKKLMNYSLLLLLCSALFVPQAHGVTQVATGGTGADAGSTFGMNGNSGIQAYAFYKPLGAYFAGLSKNSSANAISYAERPSVDTKATFTGIANANTALTNSEIRGSSITALDVVGNPTSDATRTTLSETRIVFLSSKAKNSNALPVGVHCMTTTGGDPVYRSLKDAGNAATTVNTMTLVAGNKGTTSFAFVAVKDAGVTGSGPAGVGGSGASERGTFGATIGDGIACVTIDQTTNAMTERTPKLFDYALTSTLAVYAAPLAKDMAGGPAMCYDEVLGKLYVGSGGITSAPTGGNGAPGGVSGVWGLGIYDVDAATYLSAMVKPTGEDEVVGDLTLTGSHIVGVKGSRATVAINNLKVMHTSTGPSAGTKFAYLIVNGGNGYINGTAVAGASAVGNKVWAVPLVVGNATAALNGTLADVTTANFDDQAAASGDLYTTQTGPVRVGNGPLPCPATATPTAMWVDGDAVYCSIGGAKATGATPNSPGVWRSQAYFDKFGKIAGWTEWSKAAPNELGDGEDDGGVGYIAVDAQTSRIWGVDDGTNKLVRMTDWNLSSFTNNATTKTADTTGFLTNINSTTNLGNGCTAVCDLNSSSTGWGATTPARIALLGGKDGKVCFAITGSCNYGNPSYATSTPGDITSSHTGQHHQFTTAVLDYTNSATLLKTTIADATNKTVNALAYSGWTGNKNYGYFFAGINEDGGLYVWAKPTLGAGFNPNQVPGDLSLDPFRTETGAAANYRSWQKLDRIDGTPVKIEAGGGAVYILTRDITNGDRIYQLNPQTSAAALNYDFVVTASTGQGNLSSVNRIVDFVISSSATNLYTGEQLTMLTDDGIYTTTSVHGTNGISSPANAQLHAGWVQVSSPATDGTAQFFFNEPAYNRDPQSFWYARWVANASDADVFNKNEWYQLNRAEDRFNSFGQDTLNAYDLAAGAEPSAFAQNNILCGIYNDGSRRLLLDLANSTYRLVSRPFETSTEGWNMTSNNSSLGAAFNDVTYVYWVSTLGDTGKLCAGTNKGVIGLI
jgi:hypothetical protein